MQWGCILGILHCCIASLRAALRALTTIQLCLSITEDHDKQLTTSGLLTRDPCRFISLRKQHCDAVMVKSKPLDAASCFAHVRRDGVLRVASKLRGLTAAESWHIRSGGMPGSDNILLGSRAQKQKKRAQSGEAALYPKMMWCMGVR